MADIITVDDLPQELQDLPLIAIMVAAANSRAARIAPCLISTDPAPSAGLLAEAQLVLIGALLRWKDAGSGAYSNMQAGPFAAAIDTRQRTGYNMWPSEIDQLQGLCATEKAGAFSIDTAPGTSAHLPWCSLNFNAGYCSCGVDLAGYPIFELG